jgi:cysteine sulfinate desulfinase/cysteine desulfurase-like protein
MGRSHEQAFGALRFSFGIQSTPSDVEACLAALRKLLKDY